MALGSSEAFLDHASLSSVRWVVRKLRDEDDPSGRRRSRAVPSDRRRRQRVL